MQKKTIILLLVVTSIFFFSACEGNKNENIHDNNLTENNNTEEKETLQEITLYFADEQAIGLVTEKVKVAIDNKPIEEVIIEKLKEGPTMPEKGHQGTINPGIEIIEVNVKDNTAYVNLSSQNLTGGSTAEKYLIDSIVMSLTEVDYIEKVKFLVDGESEGTLMGHFTIDKPFTRENINPKLD